MIKITAFFTNSRHDQLGTESIAGEPNDVYRKIDELMTEYRSTKVSIFSGDTLLFQHNKLRQRKKTRQ